MSILAHSEERICLDGNEHRTWSPYGGGVSQNVQMNGLGTEGEPGTLRVLRIIWVKETMKERAMKKTAPRILTLASVLILAGCGSSPETQGIDTDTASTFTTSPTNISMRRTSYTRGSEEDSYTRKSETRESETRDDEAPEQESRDEERRPYSRDPERPPSPPNPGSLSYTPDAGRLLGSQCAQCHGTNGVSVNEWDSIAGEGEVLGESFDDEPIMAAQAHGYTTEELTLIENWLQTLGSED